jgi:hypothetical protein
MYVYVYVLCMYNKIWRREFWCMLGSVWRAERGARERFPSIPGTAARTTWGISLNCQTFCSSRSSPRVLILYYVYLCRSILSGYRPGRRKYQAYQMKIFSFSDLAPGARRRCLFKSFYGFFIAPLNVLASMMKTLCVEDSGWIGTFITRQRPARGRRRRVCQLCAKGFRRS